MHLQTSAGIIRRFVSQESCLPHDILLQTGRAIQGNIQFELGWQYCGRAYTATLELNIPLYCPTQKECMHLLYDSNLVGIH